MANSTAAQISRIGEGVFQRSLSGKYDVGIAGASRSLGRLATDVKLNQRTQGAIKCRS